MRRNANVNEMEKNLKSYEDTPIILQMYLSKWHTTKKLRGSAKSHVGEKKRHFVCCHHVIKVHVTWNYFLSQWQRRMEWKPIPCMYTCILFLENDDYWLGINDDVKEGLWMFTDVGTEAPYLGWGGTEPQNAGPKGEDCAAFGHHGKYKWIDVPCTSLRRPLCERR